MSYALEGKSAIVTGATSGMGRAVARRFAREGAAVIAGGRNRERGEALIGEIEADGGRALFRPGDVREEEVNAALVEQACSSFGSLDLAVLSAGTLGIASLTETSTEMWDETLGTNLRAVFLFLKHALPRLAEGDGGCVVVIGSIAGYKVFPNHPAYCAAKGAVVQLVRQAALDYGPAVRINAIHPGQVDTPLLWDSARAFPNPETVVQETAERLPLRRLGRPEDVAEAALFLCSSRADWVTGSNFVLDGGSLSLP
jgi:NAD(P)-dependent dehydrogenase (short-subunit alcohol dehydrogenase family)